VKYIVIMVFAPQKRTRYYSGHKLPVAENVLNRDFIADKPNEKMVSDITYLWTD